MNESFKEFLLCIGLATFVVFILITIGFSLYSVPWITIPVLIILVLAMSFHSDRAGSEVLRYFRTVKDYVKDKYNDW